MSKEFNLKERTSGLKERIDNLKEKFNSLDENTLISYQNGIFFAVVVDLIGIFYFLQLKTLGTAILILCLVFLALILWKLRDFPPKKEKKHKKPRKPKYKPEKPRKPEESAINFDFGIGSPEDYNKRLEKAIGSPI